MVSRAALAALLATLLAVAPSLATLTVASSVAPAPPIQVQTDTVVAPKIVIVVGAVESTTAGYRSDADTIYAEAIKYTPNVIRIYSPNATWAAVQAAAQGASIFIYLGHGYGFPSPYKTVLTPSVHDGMGLNLYPNQGDSDKKYYGESVVSSGIRLAKNAIVILNHLCYSAGSAEPGMAEPTVPLAKERVDNFASGFLRAGARAVMADSWTGAVISMIRGIFTTHQSLGALWHALPNVHNHDITWTPLRNPSYTGIMDPDTATTGYHRSIVGNLAVQTDDVVAGAGVPLTNTPTSALQAPGAAAVGAAALPLFSDADLTTAAGGSLPAGTRVRLDQVQPDGSSTPTAAHVTTLAGATSGWVGAGGLVPGDSASPQLWAMDGQTTISPNHDGLFDSLNLLARFSEPVTWTARLLDAGSNQVASFSGSGDSAILHWDPVIGGAVAPDGDYSWAIHAVDGWGNPALNESGPFHIANAPVPATGVLTFARATASPTKASTISYSITFASPVTGLSAADFTVTGSAPGCVVGAPIGTGATFTIPIGSCSNGRVILTLEPGTVRNASLVSGPAGAFTAPSIVIDRLAPTASAPKASLRSSVALTSSALPTVLTWTGSDSGLAGLLGYDVARSTDGGAFTIIASSLPGASLNLSLVPGHSYRFEVRAIDRAGNKSGWHVGPTLSPTLVQQTSTSVAWAGSWGTTSSSAYSGGSARASSAAGASATYAFSGRSIALLMSRGPARGQAKIYVDGTYIATVDLVAASNVYQQVVFSRTFSSWGSHTIKIVAVGTATRPTVVLDAFEVVR